MEWPQITVIVLLAMSGGINMMCHGQERKNNFWIWCVTCALWVWLLISGGFFK